MTRTEERLADALDAAAQALREDTLRPLMVPERPRRRPAWIAPMAAAASLLLVVSLGVAASRGFGGSGPARVLPGGPPPRYYVNVTTDSRVQVWSTATGKPTATVPVPHVPHAPGTAAVTSARDGTFFTAAYVPGGDGERLYRFRVTNSGHVSGFSLTRAGVLGGSRWEVSAMAATADASQLAVAWTYISSISPGSDCAGSGQPGCPPLGSHPDYIDVINPATGATSVWRGGLSKADLSFNIASLSWADKNRELVFLAQWCGLGAATSEVCTSTAQQQGSRNAEVWALFPTPGGGRLDSGHLLLRQSRQLPYIAQAVISPDGSMITALVLTGQVSGGFTPDELSVRQISVVTRKLLGVPYRQSLGPAADLGVAVLALRSDSAGQHWLIYASDDSPVRWDTGFNGWIDGGRLVPMQPGNGSLTSEAW